MSATLTIRADCSPTIGTGHVMRMIALGQVWRDCGGDVHFIGDTTPLNERLHAEGFRTTAITSIHPAPEDADTLLSLTSENDWIAIDGYHFDTGYQQAIRRAGRKTLVVDDLFDREEYDANILLNQNPDGKRYPYIQQEGDTLLLGSRYTLLRKEFCEHANSIRPQPACIRNILVTLGGADAENATGSVISALSELASQELHIKVLAGAANPNFERLQEQIQSTGAAFELLTHVENMPEIMQWADFAISAAGTTCWELCFFGIPFVAVRIADNQKGVIQELKRHGAARCLNSISEIASLPPELNALLADQTARQAMSDAGRKLIDGQGSMRVVDAIIGQDYTISPAEKSDCKGVFNIANDPMTRQYFFSTENIPYETHVDWFLRRIANSSLPFYVVRGISGEIKGYIRFELEENAPHVSIALTKDVRGMSIGSRLLDRAVRKFLRSSTEYDCVRAKIKANNIPSIKAFGKAGFKADEIQTDEELVTLSRQQ